MPPPSYTPVGDVTLVDVTKSIQLLCGDVPACGSQHGWHWRFLHV
jgi:hypothetical protein